MRIICEGGLTVARVKDLNDFTWCGEQRHRRRRRRRFDFTAARAEREECVARGMRITLGEISRLRRARFRVTRACRGRGSRVSTRRFRTWTKLFRRLRAVNRSECRACRRQRKTGRLLSLDYTIIFEPNLRDPPRPSLSFSLLAKSTKKRKRERDSFGTRDISDSLA